MKDCPLHKFEDVLVTELIDGDACSISLKNGKVTIRIDDASIGVTALSSEPSLPTFFTRNPDAVVDAVAYGHRRLRYGVVKGKVLLAVINVFDGSRWLNSREARLMAYDLHFVPTIAVGHFTKDWLAMRKGPSFVAGSNHDRAGCVIRPQVQRVDDNGVDVKLILRSE